MKYWHADDLLFTTVHRRAIFQSNLTAHENIEETYLKSNHFYHNGNHRKCLCLSATPSRLFNEALLKIKLRIVYSSVHEQSWEYLTGSEYVNGQKTNRID